MKYMSNHYGQSRLLPMNLQLFAESGEGDANTGDGNTADSNGSTGNDDQNSTDGSEGSEPPEITPEIQAIIDSAVGKAKAKLKQKYETEKAEAISKAEKLAAMSEKERKEAEEAERLRELEERERAIEQKEYRLEAIKQLGVAKLSADFADVVLSDDPETTASNIKALRKQIDVEVEAEVKKRLAGRSPAGGTGSAITSRGETMAKEMNNQSKSEVKDPWAKQ